MAQYIDKSALLAEIDKRIKILQKNPHENHKTICHLDSLKQSLDTIEVKEETEWSEASIKPQFVRTEDGNKYSEPLLCRDEFGNYFIANYVRLQTGYCGWFSGDDEISVTHWKGLQKAQKGI